MPEKSASIVFYPTDKRIMSRMDPISLFDRPIPWVNEVKYLGVTLDKKLTFLSHIKRVRGRALFVMNRLSTMTNKRSKMSLRNKLALQNLCSSNNVICKCSFRSRAYDTSQTSSGYSK